MKPQVKTELPCLFDPGLTSWGSVLELQTGFDVPKGDPGFQSWAKVSIAQLLTDGSTARRWALAVLLASAQAESAG